MMISLAGTHVLPALELNPNHLDVYGASSADALKAISSEIDETSEHSSPSSLISVPLHLDTVC